MTEFWVGVASRDHVRIGVRGGFCQLCHGKASPLRRLKPGDRIVYYSPRERMGDGAPVQAFTAAGVVLKDAPRRVDMGGGFMPYRRCVRYLDSAEAPVRPLLPRLGFTRGRPSWGYAFRRGVFRIEPEDYRLIAEAMGIVDEEAAAPVTA